MLQHVCDLQPFKLRLKVETQKCRPLKYMLALNVKVLTRAAKQWNSCVIVERKTREQHLTAD